MTFFQFYPWFTTSLFKPETPFGSQLPPTALSLPPTTFSHTQSQSHGPQFEPSRSLFGFGSCKSRAHINCSGDDNSSRRNNEVAGVAQCLFAATKNHLTETQASVIWGLLPRWSTPWIQKPIAFSKTDSRSSILLSDLRMGAELQSYTPPFRRSFRSYHC